MTGNGHDIQLYNFAFAENSGFGLYATDFSNWIYDANRGDLSISKNSIIIKSFKIAKFPVIYKSFSLDYSLHLKIKVSGITDSMVIEMGNGDIGYKVLKNGLNEISGVITNETNQIGIRSDSILESCDITIEQIPDYKGALVSDGVDDYGLCENFPILTKEMGYTVCAIRKWLKDTPGSSSMVFLTKRNNSGNMNGAFTLEKIELSGNTNTYNFGKGTYVSPVFDKNTKFIFQTSKQYNGTTISSGNLSDTNTLLLFSGYDGKIEHSSIAFYAKEIYDMDLTDEEIALVKERMIKRYEEKTGETYVEEVTV